MSAFRLLMLAMAVCACPGPLTAAAPTGHWRPVRIDDRVAALGVCPVQNSLGQLRQAFVGIRPNGELLAQTAVAGWQAHRTPFIHEPAAGLPAAIALRGLLADGAPSLCYLLGRDAGGVGRLAAAPPLAFFDSWATSSSIALPRPGFSPISLAAAPGLYASGNPGEQLVALVHNSFVGVAVLGSPDLGANWSDTGWWFPQGHAELLPAPSGLPYLYADSTPGQPGPMLFARLMGGGAPQALCESCDPQVVGAAAPAAGGVPMLLREDGSLLCWQASSWLACSQGLDNFRASQALAREDGTVMIAGLLDRGAGVAWSALVLRVMPAIASPAAPAEVFRVNLGYSTGPLPPRMALRPEDGALALWADTPSPPSLYLGGAEPGDWAPAPVGGLSFERIGTIGSGAQARFVVSSHVGRGFQLVGTGGNDPAGPLFEPGQRGEFEGMIVRDLQELGAVIVVGEDLANHEGMAYASANGGESYFPLTLPAGGALRAVAIARHSGGEGATAVGPGGRILSFRNGQAHERSAQTSANLLDVAHDGYGFIAVGDEAIRRSPDGIAWSAPANTPQGRHQAIAVARFASSESTPDGQLVVVGAQGFAARSTDSGQSWQLVALPGAGGALRDVQCIAETCVAVGVNGASDGLVLVGDARGTRWRVHDIVPGAPFDSVACRALSDALQCVAAGSGNPPYLSGELNAFADGFESP